MQYEFFKQLYLKIIFPLFKVLTFILQGESDIEQLAIVIKSLGSPSEDTWPGLHLLPDYGKIAFPKSKGKSWKILVPDSPPGALELLKSLLLYNPKDRLTCEQVILKKKLTLSNPAKCHMLISRFSFQALNHLFFFTEPIGLKDEEMTLPRILSNHTKPDCLATNLDVERPFGPLFKELSTLFTY